MPPRREAMALLSRYLLTLLALTTACRYEEATTYRANKMFFTEYYMYASNAGPFPFTGGDSYVLADLRAKLSMKGTRANCLLYTSPSPRDKRQSRMPSSA